MYSAGDDTKRWLNTEDRASTGIKSPVVMNLQESPLRGSSGGGQSILSKTILGQGPPGTYRRLPTNETSSIPQSGVSSRIVGVGNAGGDSTLQAYSSSVNGMAENPLTNTYGGQGSNRLL